MKVLYVVPNWKLHETKHTSVSLYAPKSIPLEFMYVIPQLKNNIESKIIDANMLGLSFDELKQEISIWNPDVIIFNTTLNYILWRCPPVELEIPKKLSEVCRELNAVTIAIGPHSVVDSKEVINELQVDYLIIGEPEKPLVKFLNSELNDKAIAGLYSRNINNGISPENDITGLAIPDFDAVDITKYESHVWSNATKEKLENDNIKGTILEFSRGCVYHCPYCFRNGFREAYRVKTVTQIEQEILAVKKRGIGYIYFIDEIFNINNSELAGLLNILEREEMLFGVQARPDIMTYEMIDRFKKAGCLYIEYGVESLSEDVLQAIHKNLDVEHVKKIIIYSYQVFGKENVEIGWINFFTKDIMNVLGLTGNGKWISKVVRPYPNSLIGDKIFDLYNIQNNKWNFLLRYLWWSQIENYSKFYNDGISEDENIKNGILYGAMEESREESYELINSYIYKLRNNKVASC